MDRERMEPMGVPGEGDGEPGPNSGDPRPGWSPNDNILDPEDDPTESRLNGRGGVRCPFDDPEADATLVARARSAAARANRSSGVASL